VTDLLIAVMFCEASVHMQSVYVAEGTEEGYQEGKKV